jgi:alpha-tubulin suppressor-like RCC1 family protein
MQQTRITRNLFALVVAAGACGGSDSVEPPRPARLTAINATQEGTVGTELPMPLIARVNDGSGRGVAGVMVAWQASAGALNASTASTDADGRATVRWTLGTQAGQQKVVASVVGLAPAEFNATAVAGPPSSVVVTPPAVRLEPGSELQLSAQVGPDPYGNLTPPSAVVWTSSNMLIAPTTGSGVVTAGRAGTASVRATVRGVSGEGVVEVAARWRTIGAGRLHTCALDEAGYAFCWGDNSEGQLGVPDTPGDSVPLPVAGDRRYEALAVGRDHACALTTAHEAFCWGRNSEGQLGIGTFATVWTPIPMRVVGGLLFASISATGVHTCALTTPGGAAYCWGWENEGELGNGNALTFTGRPTPLPVHGGLTFRAISAGGSHTCAITPANAGYCWGNDYEGQVGDANVAEPRYRPIPTAMIGNLLIRAIATGGAHTCASTMDGGTLCWGSSESGQVGDGTDTAHLIPTTPVGGHTFSSVVPGYRHTCALTASGEAWCWGLNSDGQLGDASSLTKSRPTRVETSKRFRSLTGGWAHTCGVDVDREAYCWGAGAFGELGTGERAARASPTPVASPR